MKSSYRRHRNSRPSGDKQQSFFGSTIQPKKKGKGFFGPTIQKKDADKGTAEERLKEDKQIQEKSELQKQEMEEEEGLQMETDIQKESQDESEEELSE